MTVAAQTNLHSSFQPSQIVFLEHLATRLYAEIVQVVEARCLCWVRPIALVTHLAAEFSDWTNYDRLTLQDLRQGSDLMCPTGLFQAAIDLEVLPLFDQLQHLESEAKFATAHRNLHQFIQDIWRDRPDAFAP